MFSPEKFLIFLGGRAEGRVGPRARERREPSEEQTNERAVPIDSGPPFSDHDSDHNQMTIATTVRAAATIIARFLMLRACRSSASRSI